MKYVKIGGIRFSPEAYKRFTDKKKEDQIKLIFDSLTPKDEALAVRILKNIPYGQTQDIVSGNEPETIRDNREGSSRRSGKDGREGRGKKII